MPTARLVQIEAWSHSRYQTYTACPYKAKLLNIDKMKEPDSASGAKGNRAHAFAAAWVTRKMPKLDFSLNHLRPEILKFLKAGKIPTELARFSEEFAVLRKAKAQCEEEWAFDRLWNPTSWFGPQAWLRIKVDTVYTTSTKQRGKLITKVHICDYKTGKIYEEEHALQRSLYALGAFLRYPDAAEVIAEHWYLEDGQERKGVWKAPAFPALQAEWLRRTEAMLNDKTFAPNPGQHCRWCWFSAGKRADQSDAEKRLHPCKF